MPSRICLLLIFVFVLLENTAFAQLTEKSGPSWQQTKKTHKGTLPATWFESRPFIYESSDGDMRGIEPEIMRGFQAYLKEKYNVDLQISWKKASSFGNTFTRIRDNKNAHMLGVSAFSTTPERLSEVGFGPPYMSDIAVLITSKNIPILKSPEEFTRAFRGLTAVTIRATTYEQDIIRLKTAEQLPFNIEYIPSSENILHHIEKRDSAFGFIDLPVYLMLFNENPAIHVNRQNMFPVKRKGYAIIYPINSDWGIPLAEYFSRKEFKAELETIISHYLDVELYRFLETLAERTDDDVALLTKEKEIQNKSLATKTEQILREISRRNFLTALVGIILVFLILIIVLYRKRNEQKIKIEAQRQNIERNNQQLEKRNEHLLTLDEEKNNLIRILAHDLRTPINQVQGLAHIFLLTNTGLPEEDKNVIRQIADASIRLNKMITNTLDIDALENNRVKVFLENVRVSPVVQQIVASFEKQAFKKDITVVFSTNDPQCLIHADSLFLIQVFENLISNAIKFSPKGKPIEVSVQRENNRVTITVTDHGPGLTDDDKENLFKKFQSLSAKPTDGESSTGLGLSIVKRYVTLMGGEIVVHSQDGEGASFQVTFDAIRE